MDGRGGFRVPRIDQVVDCGVAINPDRVRSQMEGAAVMGVGLARTGEITAANGRIVAEQLRPLPGGAHDRCALPGERALRGERGAADRRRRAGPAAGDCALGNALYAATGKRARELPLSKMKWT